MALTYAPIATTTLASDGNFTFSSIPGTYTDLRVVLVGTSTNNNSNTGFLMFNGDTWASATNYSTVYISGYGSGSSSGMYNSTAAIRTSVNSNTSTSLPFIHTYDIFSYAGSTYKTVLAYTAADNNGGGASNVCVGLWQSTAAITSLSVINANYGYKIGTVATIYGIKAA